MIGMIYMRTSELEQEISLDNSVIKKPIKKHSVLFQKQNIFYLLLFLFILGMMYGSVLLKEDNTSLLKNLASIQDVYIRDKLNQSVFLTICNSFVSSGLFFAITFLCGFSAIGQPFTLLVPFVKGLGIGSSIGYLYLNYGIAGIGYSALLMIPSAIISIFSLVLSARESIRLSNTLASLFLKGSIQISKAAFRLYLLKHFILLIFILISALLEGLLTFLFAGLFQIQ